MAKIVKKHRVHCPIRHVNAFVIEWDDGSISVKCGLLKACGDSCPYLKNSNYRSLYRSSPEYKPKK